MIERIYPQEEERFYIDENKYLLILLRKGRATDNNMSVEDFSRNVWLMDGDREIWRIRTNSDDQESPFRSLSTTRSEYIAYRWKDWNSDAETFLIDMKTGQAALYPPDRDPYAGPEMELVRKWETRIYLADGSYIVRVSPLENTPPLNVYRINAQGEQMWQISSTPEYEADPLYNTYEWLYIGDDGAFVVSLDERIQFVLDIETGKAVEPYYRK